MKKKKCVATVTAAVVLDSAPTADSAAVFVSLTNPPAWLMELEEQMILMDTTVPPLNLELMGVVEQGEVEVVVAATSLAGHYMDVLLAELEAKFAGTETEPIE